MSQKAASRQLRMKSERLTMYWRKLFAISGRGRLRDTTNDNRCYRPEHTDQVTMSHRPLSSSNQQQQQPAISGSSECSSPSPTGSRHPAGAGSSETPAPLPIDEFSFATQEAQRGTASSSFSLSLQASSSRLNGLGLHLVQTPQHPIADLVLVHGLGGSWLRTWSWNRNPDFFWPQWLPSDVTFSGLRVFSYGYNADFKGSAAPTSILDFSRDLLLKMQSWFVQGEQRIGQIPIIFVAHSMGGLVVKEAYIIGAMDKKYTSMIARTLGIIFLSTPHRGSTLASTLNNILSVSAVSSSKMYVSELERQSPTLQHINEMFRLVCQDLRLVSFYETLKTSIGGMKKLVVDKDSGVLGYPSETSSPMVADHHNVCKYSSPDDPNFVALKDVLRGWLLQLCAPHTSPHSTSDPRSETSREPPSKPPAALARPRADGTLLKAAEICGIDSIPDLDRHQVMDGTCKWILQQDKFEQWLQTEPPGGSRILWVTGLPGTGKSTLASSIVRWLNDSSDKTGTRCQHHFFSFADSSRRTVPFALRSIAFQLAAANPGFLAQLLQLHQQIGVCLDQLDAQVIWNKIFQGIVFKLDLEHPLYWIFDGLDECDSPVPLLALLLRLQSRSSIRIFLTSRPTRDLISIASSRRKSLHHAPLSAANTEGDIKLFIKTSIEESIPIEEGMVPYVIERMSVRASGSFLWAKLALTNLEKSWYTVEDIQKAIEDVPEGMESLFERMLDSILSVRKENERHFALATRILTWATCSAEPMTIPELAEALKPEFGQVTNLRITILHLCGQFLTTDGFRISLIHETARSFLLDTGGNGAGFLDAAASHEHLATVCITYLGKEKLLQALLGLRTSDSTRKGGQGAGLAGLLLEYPLLRYAATYWAYHASHADVTSSEFLAQMQLFFNKHVLTWIHVCVVMKSIRQVTISAQQVQALVRRRMTSPHSSSSRSPGRGKDKDGDEEKHKDKDKDSHKDSHKDRDKDSHKDREHNIFFQQWAVDLVRMASRFAGNLTENPASIYKIVPQLCPSGSMVFRTYSSAGTLRLKGLSYEAWDDCLARFHIGGEHNVSKVLTTGAYFTCLIPRRGTVVVFSAETCEEATRIVHGPTVESMAMNKTGSLLATAGSHLFRVWGLPSGEEVYCLSEHQERRNCRVMAISFGSGDSELLVGYSQGVVDCWEMSSRRWLWTCLLEAPEDNNYSRHAAREMVFSPDTASVALAYHGSPVLVWTLDKGGQAAGPPRQFVLAGSLLRPDKFQPYIPVEKIKWAPDGGSLFVLYQDTELARFFICDAEEDGEEPRMNRTTGAKEITVSPDGRLLLTWTVGVGLRLWTLPDFRLIHTIPHDDDVRDITFSPDSQRFFDAGGTSLNVWEPEVLIQAVDQLSRSERADTSLGRRRTARRVSSPLVGAGHIPRSRQIIALVCSPTMLGEQYYACGTECGSVAIHESGEGNLVCEVMSHREHAALVAWSPTSGRYLASFGDHTTIVVKRLGLRSEETTTGGRTTRWDVLPCLEIEVGSSVSQLLFSTSERFLLASDMESDRAWDLNTGTQVWRRDLGPEARWFQRRARWTNHPEDPDLVMCIAPETTEIRSWSSHPDGDAPTAHQAGGGGCPPPPPPLLPQPDLGQQATQAGVVRHLATVPIRKYIICETVPEKLAYDHTRVSGRELQLKLVAPGHPGPPRAAPALDLLSPSVRHLLGCYRDHLVFLNHEFWICTWPLASLATRDPKAATETLGIRRHFFLPRSCIAPDVLPLIRLAWDDGTVLFPKNGEVAIVTKGLRL